MKKYLMIAFLILTASAGACEIISVEDTISVERFSATDGWVKYNTPNTLYTLMRIEAHAHTASSEECTRFCSPSPLPDTTRFYAKVDTTGWFSCTGANSVAVPILDITWLPKVQVWLDSAEYREYEAWRDNYDAWRESVEL
ncbi:hypothetical protein LCGC14_1130980 [marine sediment metagenome]|uniref:Lipoprotein n=1 Tax=marine sediment metagenome TaxID=412755 RepID=A0A0F9MNW8_9ZZZZ